MLCFQRVLWLCAALTPTTLANTVYVDASSAGVDDLACGTSAAAPCRTLNHSLWRAGGASRGSVALLLRGGAGATPFPCEDGGDTLPAGGAPLGTGLRLFNRTVAIGAYPVGARAELDCAGRRRALVAYETTLHVRDVLVRRGFADRGGAILALCQERGTLQLERAVFEFNVADSRDDLIRPHNGGGALFVQACAALNVSASAFTSNAARNYQWGTGGGAIHAESTALDVRGSTFTNNTAAGAAGGAVLAYHAQRSGSWRPATVSLVNTTFDANRVWCAVQPNCTIAGGWPLNQSLVCGQRWRDELSVYNVPYCSGGAVTIVYSSAYGTVAGASVVLQGNMFHRCTASAFATDADAATLPQLLGAAPAFGSGGALAIVAAGLVRSVFDGGTIRADNNTFAQCQASRRGGAVFLAAYDGMELRSSNVSFRANSFVGNAVNNTLLPAQHDWLQWHASVSHTVHPLVANGGAVSIEAEHTIQYCGVSFMGNAFFDNIAMADATELDRVQWSPAPPQAPIVPSPAGGAVDVNTLQSVIGSTFEFRGNQFRANQLSAAASRTLAAVADQSNLGGGGGLRCTINLGAWGVQDCLTQRNNVVLADNLFASNHGAGIGGGAFVYSRASTAVSCNASENSASLSGNAWLNNSVTGANAKGGGLVLQLGNPLRAEAPTGGVQQYNMYIEWVYAWRASLVGESFELNNAYAGAAGRGGGLVVQNGNFTITNSTLRNNTAGWSGGGIAVLPGSAAVQLAGGTLLDSNVASIGGEYYSADASGGLGLYDVHVRAREGWGIFAEAVGEVSFGLEARLGCEPGHVPAIEGDPYTPSVSEIGACDTSHVDFLQSQFASFCLACPTGRHASLGGLLQRTNKNQLEQARICEPCDAGQFQALVGQGACEPCVAGQYTNQAGQAACIPCPDGSISSSGMDHCVKCPPGVACVRGGMTQSEGWWRSPRAGDAIEAAVAGTLGDHLYECFNEVCIGSEEMKTELAQEEGKAAEVRGGESMSDNTAASAMPGVCLQRQRRCQGDGQCEEGYTGPVCKLCAPEGYSRKGNRCIRCAPFDATNIAGVVLLVLGVVLLITVFYLNWRSAWMQPAVLKIVITFLEMISVMDETFAVEMPEAYDGVVAWIRAVFANVAQLSALSCAVHINRFVHLAVWTLGELFALAVVYALYCRGAGQSTTAKQPALWQVCVKRWFYVLFFSYPLLSPVVMSIFICRTIDGTSYLVADYALHCEGGTWALASAWAALWTVFYVVGYPVVLLVALRRRSEAAEFVAEDFKDQPVARCWEVLGFGKKLFLTSILLFLPEGTAAREALAVLVAGFVLVLLVWHKPFADDIHNRLEFAVSSALVLTYFIILMMKVHTSASQRHVYSAVLILLLCFVVVAGVCAICALRKIARAHFRGKDDEDHGHGVELAGQPIHVDNPAYVDCGEGLGVITPRATSPSAGDCGGQVARLEAELAQAQVQHRAELEATRARAKAEHLAEIARLRAELTATPPGQQQAAGEPGPDAPGGTGHENKDAGRDRASTVVCPASLVGCQIEVVGRGVGTVTGVKRSRGKPTLHTVVFEGGAGADLLLQKADGDNRSKFYVLGHEPRSAAAES